MNTTVTVAHPGSKPPVMKTRYSFWASIRDLRKGDVVCCAGMASSPWSTAIVRQADDKTVDLWRPYGRWNADLGISYIGVEEHMTYLRDSAQTLWVYQGEREAGNGRV